MLKLLRKLAPLLAGCLVAVAQTPTPTPTEKPATEAKPSRTPQSGVEAPRAADASKTAPAQSTKSDAKKPPPAGGGMEILSDTRGVDFEPYIKRLHVTVEDHWYPLIPKEALPPTMESGSVTIELAIMRDGSIQGMKVVHSSGNEALDRAAYGALLSAAPLPRLPAEFTGPSLRLLCIFIYNPEKKIPDQAPQPDKK